MTVLDASVLIAHFDVGDAHHADARALLAGLTSVLVVSPLTMAEVLVGPTRSGDPAVIVAAVADLGVHEVRLPDDAAPRLAALRVETRLRLPDCCVLLAAQDADRQLATFDQRLALAGRSRGLTVVG